MAALASSLLACALADCGGGSETTPSADVGGPTFPCAIDQSLARNCRECHARPPRNGAPFPLVSFADTRANYAGSEVRVHMLQVIDMGFMPPAPRQLPSADRAALLAWLGQGAPAAQPGDRCP